MCRSIFVVSPSVGSSSIVSSRAGRVATAVLVVVVSFYGSSALVADTVEVAASRDNTLYEHPDGALSNGAGDHFFAGTTNRNEIRRGLVAFDLEGVIPADSVINDVTLTLNMSKTNFGSGVREISLHRVLADWGQGSSAAPGEEGGGTSASSDDATWVHRFFDTDDWMTPGGDFAGASATREVGTLGAYTWGSTPEMVLDVQGWVDDPASNFGWLLKAADEGPSRTAKRFDSSEHPTAARRPVLSIDFTPPAMEPAFRRGDANADGAVDSSDAVALLEAFFASEEPLACQDAADTNDDGALDISDAVGILLELFGGVSIPEPGASACGVDPTADDLGCTGYTADCS